MDINDLHPPDDYSHRFFIWHEWIQANGPLTAENVFDYFTTSMFYDKQSNNQVLRMQTIYSGLPVANEAEELKRFTGVEFAVVHAQPPSLFIIQKRERLSPEEVRPMAAYFVVNNRIYQSPDIYTILSNRLLTALHSLQTSLDVLRSHRPDYTPRTGFVWPVADPSIVANEEIKKRGHDQDEIESVMDEEHTGPSTSLKQKLPANSIQGGGGNEPPKRQQNNMLLLNAMRTTAAHSQNSVASSSFAAVSIVDAAAVTQLGAGSQVDTPGGASGTPGPPPGSSSRDETPKVAMQATNAPTPQEPTKAPPGAGKKKRKRTGTSLPTAPG